MGPVVKTIGPSFFPGEFSQERKSLFYVVKSVAEMASFRLSGSLVGWDATLRSYAALLQNRPIYGCGESIIWAENEPAILAGYRTGSIQYWTKNEALKGAKNRGNSETKSISIKKVG